MIKGWGIMRKCPNCGKEIIDSADKCSSCGADLEDTVDSNDFDNDFDDDSDNETLSNIKEGIEAIFGFFILLVLINITGFFVNCLCGQGTAGNGCRQVPKCTKEEIDGYTYKYYSIPLCGGCSTSECGMNSACWGEKLELAMIRSEETNESFFGCSEQYYGSCTGCGYNPYYIYCGHIKYDDGTEIKYSGDTNSEKEKVKIKTDGCYYKFSNDENYFAYLIPNIGEEESDAWLEQIWNKFMESGN